MVAFDYGKRARSLEKQGRIKEAADYYSHINPKRAYEIYEKILSSTRDREVVEDIGARLKRDKNSPMYLRKLVPIARKRSSYQSTRKTLDRRFIPAILSIISFVFALFFVAFSMTGYAILESNQNNSRLIGLCLLVCGLIFALIHLRREKKD